MPTVNYVMPDGSVIVAEVDEGRSIMEAALASGVEGIIGECGGVCSCATCHAYIDSEWIEKVGEAVDDEADMLEFLDSCKPESRLTCQIHMTDELDGIKVYIPEEQD